MILTKNTDKTFKDLTVELNTFEGSSVKKDLNNDKLTQEALATQVKAKGGNNKQNKKDSLCHYCNGKNL